MNEKTNNQLARERAAAEASRRKQLTGGYVLSGDALAGAAFFEDRNGRVWNVKVFTLGDAIASRSDYTAALSALAGYYSDATQAAIERTKAITVFLQSLAPSLLIRWRRFRVLPDYTPYYVARHFPAADFDALRDAIFKANTGEDFETYVTRAIKAAEEEAQKKRTE